MEGATERRSVANLTSKRGPPGKEALSPRGFAGRARWTGSKTDPGPSPTAHEKTKIDLEHRDRQIERIPILVEKIEYD